MNTAIAYTYTDVNVNKKNGISINPDTTSEYGNECGTSYQYTLRRIETTTLNREIQRLEDAFALLGWHDLHDSLKTEISDDVSQMIEELEGQYSSINPDVKQRRKTIRYWIDCYQQGICTRQTALNALQLPTD